jgi:ADP-ribose pyrophosphatase YjhB (NUDIX family)
VGVRPGGILARGPWDTSRVEARQRGVRRVLLLRSRRIRLAGYHAADDRLVLDLEPARWALRLGSDALDSISSLCAVRDADGRWLAGRRAEWVASWPGRWALGAGGAVEVGESPAATLTRELHEEWAVRPERLSVEALVRSPNGLVLLVGMAHLSVDAEVERDAEHDEHAWWPADPAEWPEEADTPLRLMAAMLDARADG